MHVCIYEQACAHTCVHEGQRHQIPRTKVIDSCESSMWMLGTEPLKEQYSCLTTELSLNPKFVTFQECLILAKNYLIKYNNQKNWLDKFVMIHLSISIFVVDIRCKVAGFSRVELV